MNVELEIPRQGLRAWARGDEEALDCVEDTLNRWANQLSPDEHGMAVWTRRPGTIECLAGALIAALQPEALTPPNVVWVLKSLPRLTEAGLLWPEQEHAVRAAWMNPWGRGIISSPTGSGKSRMCAGVMAIGSILGVWRWSYLVTNQELTAQSSRQFKDLVPRMINAMGEDCDWECSCSSYGTAGAELATCQGLLIDEVHVVPPATRSRVVARATEAVFRLGLSATPLLRQDAGNAMVIGLLGPVCHSVTPKELIAAGRISPGRFTLVSL